MAKRLIKIHELQIDESPPRPGSGAFRRVKESFADEEAFVDGTFETLPRCAHGHLIHKPEELGGQCVVCGRYLCHECATLRCSLDGNLACREHALIEADRVICANHNPLRLLFFSIFRA